jgi:hypothetical protein
MDGIFDQLAKMFCERSEIMFLTADLLTRLRYLDRRQFQKEDLFWHHHQVWNFEPIETRPNFCNKFLKASKVKANVNEIEQN